MPEIHFSDGLGRFGEQSLKSMGKAETIDNRKFLLMQRSLNLTVYSRKVKEEPGFPEKRAFGFTKLTVKY